MNQHNSIRRNKYVANCLSLITLILSRASIPAHSRLAERWNSFASCIKRKSTLPIEHELVDNRLSPNSNPTTDGVQGLFSYRQESAYRGTSSLGIQKTQQTRYKVCFPTGKNVLTEALPVWEFKRHNRQGTRFVFLQPRRCLQTHFQTGNPKDTIDKQYPSYTNTPNLKKIIIIKGNSLK